MEEVVRDGNRRTPRAGGADMARKWLLGLVAFVSAGSIGCSTLDGPRKNKEKPKPDLPSYSIEEQERRGRDKYAIPNDDFRTGPPTFIGKPSPTGR